MEYSFNVEHAKNYGVNEAIFIRNMMYWVQKNKASKSNIHNGDVYTFNTIKGFSVIFPFWSEGQIRRVIESLLKQKIIKVGNFNKKKYDRTKWYAFVDYHSFVENSKCNCRKQQMQLSKTTNAIVENSKPIPNIKRNIVNEDNKHIYKDMLAVYDDFCLKHFDAPAKINGAEGNALKQIIVYLKKVAQKKGYAPETCIDSFTYILKNWHKLDAFTQKQIKLTQINSSLTNIINQLKNGTEANKQSVTSLKERIQQRNAGA